MTCSINKTDASIMIAYRDTRIYVCICVYLYVLNMKLLKRAKTTIDSNSIINIIIYLAKTYGRKVSQIMKSNAQSEYFYQNEYLTRQISE